MAIECEMALWFQDFRKHKDLFYFAENPQCISTANVAELLYVFFVKQGF